LKTNTFSIVVGTTACNMDCPYCVSKMTCTEAPKSSEVNWDRFSKACQIVEKASDGLISVLLTGKGEPLLYQAQIQAYLSSMSGQFPLVDLQTNGVAIPTMKSTLLPLWRNMGLSLVCVSVAHWNPTISSRIMGGPADYDWRHAVHAIKEAGLACRLNLTMVGGAIDSVEGIDKTINVCKELEIEQLTIRRVTRPHRTISPEVSKWVGDHFPDLTEEGLYRHLLLDGGGKVLLELPHGASVFDVRGQNVCVNNCLTSTSNPDEIRQIIFFPDGRIAYDWCYPGARIL